MARLCILAFCAFVSVTVVAQSNGISWTTSSTNDTSIYSYNFNSGVQSLLASYNFPSLSLKASAVDKNSDLLYLIMKDVRAANYILLTLDLTNGANGSVALQSLPSKSLEYSDAFVDNTGDLYAIVQDASPLSGAVQLFSVDTNSGNLKQSLSFLFKSYKFFVSSSFFTNSNTYISLFTSLDNARSQFLTYNVDSNTWNTYDSPNGLAAIAADSNSGLLRGVLTNAPPGSTQLVTYNYSTSNTTYIGAPLTAKNYASCGFARGVMTQGAYYVNCCADSLCLQGSAVYSNNLQNNNMNFVTKISAPVTAGLFAF